MNFLLTVNIMARIVSFETNVNKQAMINLLRQCNGRAGIYEDQAAIRLVLARTIFYAGKLQDE